ncbi:MAG: hypothetical protein JW731_13180 [Bacteroidales bacterium]|nr:hypothetical protein [Bacteroidales bacterium]
MKKLIFVAFVLLVIFACDEENSPVKVQYRVSDAYAETHISYQNESGSLESETINFQSAEDTWNYSFEAKHGDIVYISAQYADTASSVNISILLDGKVYKEKYSESEPGKIITVSGTIPF